MSGELPISGFNLVVVLAALLLLFVLLRRLRTFITNLPLSTRRRAMLRRARPLLEVALFTGLVVVSVRLIVPGDSKYSDAALAIVLLGVVVTAWSALRDLMAGMLIKTSELFLPGDFIEVDGVSGWVRGLGYRVIALETPEGDQIFVPYSRVSRSSLVRKPAADGIFRHTYEIEIPLGVEDVELREVIRKRALYAHWSSVVREPQMQLIRDGVLSVTVFSVGFGQGPLIERSVRRALVQWLADHHGSPRPPGSAPPRPGEMDAMDQVDGLDSAGGS